jgi:hypothetical protein
MSFAVPPKLTRPSLANPVVIDLMGKTSLPRLKDTQDYIINLPHQVWPYGLNFRGGRNIVVVGGYLSTPQGATNPNITIENTTAQGATLWLEGLLIDGQGGGLSDAFHINTAPNRYVDIFNCRVDELNGSYSTTHADVIQNLGCKRLRVQKFTGRSHYNNIYMRRENNPLLGPIGPSTFNHVNVGGYKTNPNAKTGDPTHTLRGLSLGTQPNPPGDETSAVNCQLTGSVWLFEYYAAAAEAGLTLDQFAWPFAGKRFCPDCVASVDTSVTPHQLKFPAWNTDTHPPREETTPSTFGQQGSGNAQVYGVIKDGLPVHGDFVAAGSVGLAYPRAA